MKKFALALLATAALSMPAIAAPNANQQSQSEPSQQPQQSQSQQPQSQQPQSQAQGTQQNANQAAQNQPKESQTIAPDRLSRSQVRQVQLALERNGFQVGRRDGRWGPETTNALKQFQQSKSVQANGELDQQTIADLGLNGARFAQRNGQTSQQQGNSQQQR
jgi:peptidoglycan hydrolase-like protein with peptidoglycan-binding domain